MIEPESEEMGCAAIQWLRSPYIEARYHFMTRNKNIWKRIISGIIVICLVVALLPASAFAADSSSTFAPTYRTLNPDGSYGATLSSTELTIVEGGNLNKTADGKIDLWVTAKEEFYQIPHVEDNSGNTWYLKNISLINDYFNPTDTQEVMNADAILAAKSMDDYVLEPAEVEIDIWAETAYLVCYGWTNIPPEQWDNDPGEQAIYTVGYNLNYPSGVDSISIINENGIPPQEGPGYNKVPETVEELGGTVQEGMNFAVADGLNDALEGEELKGFLAYNVNDSSTTSYYFAGWKDKNGNLYDIDEIVTANKDLADEDNVIQFIGVWEKINPYSEEKLADIETRLPLDVFTRGDNGDLLIDQSTDTLDKDNNSISYTVSAGFNGNLLAKDENVPFKGSDFATFEIIVNVDPNLEFANLSDNGTVTLSMASNLVIPQTIETTSGLVNWAGSEGNWTVTVDPTALPSSESGMQIVINAAFTDQNYTNFADKMALTGLDFKLKDGAFDVDGAAPEVKTSANLTAKIDLRNIAQTGNTRFRYFVLRNLLMNNNAWSTYFDDGLYNPTAYMNALQFLDYKLADYDLRADALASLKANTVVANGEFTITAMADEHGSISPSGTVTVKRDGSQSFTITPDSGYRIADVKVDGTSVGAVKSYTFENVTADHTITVTFEKKSSPPIVVPPDDDDDDQPEDPDDTGVSDLLNTKDHDQYLFGYPDGTFGPGLNMTRAEAAQMFYNLLVDQDVTAKPVFDDVPEDAWYAEPVNVMAKLGIVKGVGDDMFEPNREITRAEFTAMAMRFAQGETGGKNIFSDVDEDDWFYEVVVDSIKYGWIEGYPDGTFRPQNLITREEVTTIVNRMLGRLPDEKFIDAHEDDLDLFPDVTKNWAYYDVVEATNDHQYKKTSSGEDWTKLG